MMTAIRGLATVLYVFAAACNSDTPEAELRVSGQAAHAAKIYAEHCAACHDVEGSGAPLRESLEQMTVNQIQTALTEGAMKQQGAALNRFDLVVLAEYLGREAPVIADAGPRCDGKLEIGSDPLWSSWGGGKSNARFQPAAKAGLTPSDVRNLELSWAFGFPGAQRARSQPAVTPEAIFTGSQSGRVYALAPQTGCIWWTYEAGSEVRNAPLIGTSIDGAPDTLFFGDFGATVHAVDIATGERRWSRSIKDHPDGTITGSIVQHGDTIFVPMSSTEVLSAYSDEYECCSFRGGVSALDAKTGETRWRWYSTAKPQETGKNATGAKQFGPSGAPVWSTPTIDTKRGLLYVGTGENYSLPAGRYSDAIVALDLESGRVRWTRQTVAGDAWNAACSERGASGANCPKDRGPDFDFGAPPILVTLAGGKDILLAGQKSGEVFGLDPADNGRILWRRRAGMGGFNGGIHWGMASDGKTLWVGIADTPGSIFAEGPPRPGIHAFEVASGRPRWSRIEPMTCDEPTYACMTAFSAPLTAIPGVVFGGAHNGRLVAHAAADGLVLWKTETNRPFETVNGVEARGGSIDGAGVVVAGGMVVVNSGYDKFGEIPGNVLLVYRPRKGGS